jgi:hypothetical protein
MEKRRFARRCDDEELADLCGLGGAGWELTWSHVLQLIRVIDREERIEVTAECAKNSWSVRELQRDIDRQGLHRPYGGRKQKPPKTADEALVVTERLLCSFLRWVSVVTAAATQTNDTSRSKTRKRTKRKSVIAVKLSRPIRTALADISTQAFELCEQIRDELEKLRSKARKNSRRRS